MSVLVQVFFGLVWLLLGAWHLAGILTATRPVLVWDWILAVGFLALSLLWFVTAYVKARKDKRSGR